VIVVVVVGVGVVAGRIAMFVVDVFVVFVVFVADVFLRPVGQFNTIVMPSMSMRPEGQYDTTVLHVGVVSQPLPRKPSFGLGQGQRGLGGM
jgi:hypothetical protein